MSIANKILAKAEELSMDLGKARRDFVKSLITISTGFLALFIGLKSDPFDVINAKYFFFATILFLVIGIVFSTISLFQEVYYIKQNIAYLKEKTREYVENESLASTLFNSTKKPLMYKLFEYIGFGSLLISPITLVIYIYFQYIH